MIYMLVLFADSKFGGEVPQNGYTVGKQSNKLMACAEKMRFKFYNK